MARIVPLGSSTRVIDSVIVDAHERAAAIVASAESARETARLAGLEAGRNEGLGAVTELLVKARREAADRAAATEPGLRRLAVRIAEKILGRELELKPDAVCDIVRTALEAARTRRDLVVRVHPGDLDAVVRARPRLSEAVVHQAGLTFRADPGVPRGGCLVDTEVGTLDARLEVQLAAIERALLEDQ